MPETSAAAAGIGPLPPGLGLSRRRRVRVSESDQGLVPPAPGGGAKMLRALLCFLFVCMAYSFCPLKPLSPARLLKRGWDPSQCCPSMVLRNRVIQPPQTLRSRAFTNQYSRSQFISKELVIGGANIRYEKYRLCLNNDVDAETNKDGEFSAIANLDDVSVRSSRVESAY